MSIDYFINPTLMGGKVKEIKDNQVKINLRGRLGVLYISKDLFFDIEKVKESSNLKCYFSYFQVNQQPYDYDYNELKNQTEMTPALVGGKITHVNDTAIEVELPEKLGKLTVPHRWVFTDIEIKENMNVEFFISKIALDEKI